MEAIVSKITAELESISNRMNRHEKAYNKVSSNETRPNESSKNGTALSLMLLHIIMPQVLINKKWSLPVLESSFKI